MNQPRRRKAQGRTQARRKPATGSDFWGTEPSDDDDVDLIHPSDEPSAMVKSLGPPPIPGHETAAEHYFDAVYEKASQLAIALAAANDLLDTGDEDEFE